MDLVKVALIVDDLCPEYRLALEKMRFTLRGTTPYLPAYLAEISRSDFEKVKLPIWVRRVQELRPISDLGESSSKIEIGK